MKDFLEALVRVLRENFGIEVDYPIPPTLLLGVASFAMLPTLFAAILWLRRHLGDARAISSEMQAAANMITTETRGELSRLLGEFATLNDNLKSTVNERFDALHGFLKSTIQIGAVDDGDIESDQSVGQSRKTRVHLAEQVRNAVIERWLNGQEFVRSATDPNSYVYEGSNEAGEAIRLLFQSPYRAGLGEDGRLPFTLEVWVDGYKKLNFEWNSEGGYSLRGFKRGDWIEDIANWNLRATGTKRNRRVA